MFFYALAQAKSTLWALPYLSVASFITVTTVILDHIVTLALDIIVAFNTVIEFVIPLVALLTSLPVRRTKEYLWNLVYSKECTFPVLLLR
jgi:hypothetical protein